MARETLVTTEELPVTYEVDNELVYKYVADDLKLAPRPVINTILLLQDGATVPFIARYRKERTEGLDEIEIRAIEQKLLYYNDLEKRKQTVVRSIQEQGKLTDALFGKITNCRDKQLLEDLYLPFKPKKKTKASIAREKGLQPLADAILAQEHKGKERDQLIAGFVDPEKGVKTAAEAIQGAVDILTETISEDADLRKWTRSFAEKEGYVVATAKKEWEGKKSKFEMYYNFSEQLKLSASHRLLAIRRGATEGVLNWKIDISFDSIESYICDRYIKNQNAACIEELYTAITNAAKRILTSAEVEVFAKSLERAEEEAITVFSKNLRALLLESPAGPKVIMGVDPGFRTGCKVVVIDACGNFKEFSAIYPHPPQEDVESAGKTIVKMLQKYDVDMIAVGNGTASRETHDFLKFILKGVKSNKKIQLVMVSEAGASVYSASPVAAQEFPDLDVTVRGAISIGRRMQDPLAELVKIDPKSIGVGQYQHDVNQVKLKEGLDGVVESCVNFVGIELNTASKELLSYVAGIGPALAQNIVKFREKNGAFKTRSQLLKVEKLGAKAFEQSAGFLRIHTSSNRLDNSAIHPERYELVTAMAESIGTTVDALLGNETIIKKIDLKSFVTQDVGLPTLTDIVSELKKPGRDPREEFTNIEFNQDVSSLEDLEEDMELAGKVTNVANFGAFVDIGVHQDGLIHISKLSRTFVKDPHDVIAVGDKVRVKVLAVDKELKRISLQRLE